MWEIVEALLLIDRKFEQNRLERFTSPIIFNGQIFLGQEILEGMFLLEFFGIAIFFIII